ncbi:MAG: hypothetical protein ABSB36_02665 [Candidatus Dormibacteria bacterium]
MAVAPEHSPPSATPGARTRLPRPGLGGLIVGAALIATLVVICRRVGDPDFWWHMETGSWIIDHGAFPSHELYTYTASNRVWADQEWGSEVLGDLIFRAGGFLAFSLAYVAVTWVGFWFVWRRIALERVPALIAGGCIAVATAAGVEVWGPRSQMISFALTCLTLYWVESYLRDRNRHLYVLPVVMVVWANLHGGFVYGLAVVGLAAVTEAVLWLVSPEDGAHRRRSLRLWVVLAASAVAGLLNPITFHAYLAAIQTQTSAVQQTFIAEWHSPSFHSLGEVGLELLLLLVVFAMAFRRPRLWDALLTVVGVYAALSAVRNAPLAAAALTPMVAWSLGGAWERSRWQEPLGRWIQRRASDLLILVSAGALIVTVGAVGIATHTLSSQAASTDANFPVGAANWLESHPTVGTRMFNAYDWGGYLIYRFYPDRPVFIYGEATELGNRLLQQVSDVENAEPDWQTILGEHGVNYVVERTDSALSMALGVDPQWKQVYNDGFAVIFVKR